MKYYVKQLERQTNTLTSQKLERLYILEKLEQNNKDIIKTHENIAKLVSEEQPWITEEKSNDQ